MEIRTLELEHLGLVASVFDQLEASDKNTIIEAFMKIKNGLNLDDAAYFIADSAVYSEKNIQQLGTKMLWITRIPATITESESLLDRDVELVECLDSRYKCFSTTSNYGGIPQKWVLYQSQPMQERKEKTFEMQLEKENKQAERSPAKLKRRKFAYEADAGKEAELWLDEHSFHRFEDLSTKLVTKRNGKLRGRPRKGEELLEVHFVEGEIEINAEKVAEAKYKLGRFILATNDLSLDQWRNAPEDC